MALAADLERLVPAERNTVHLVVLLGERLLHGAKDPLGRVWRAERRGEVSVWIESDASGLHLLGDVLEVFHGLLHDCVGALLVLLLHADERYQDILEAASFLLVGDLFSNWGGLLDSELQVIRMNVKGLH